jgi:hypothetical protein
MKIAELSNCQKDIEGVVADINVSFNTDGSCFALLTIFNDRENLSQALDNLVRLSFFVGSRYFIRNG